LDRNAILSGLISSYQSYSGSDSRATVEKVLKYSGDSADLIQRADVKREVAVFRLNGGNAIININDEKPLELEQDFQVLVYVEQGDSHSVKEARYDRMLELTDQIMDWATETRGSTITNDVYTITLTTVGSTDEQDGYLSTILNFQSILKLQ